MMFKISESFFLSLKMFAIPNTKKNWTSVNNMFFSVTNSKKWYRSFSHLTCIQFSWRRTQAKPKHILSLCRTAQKCHELDDKEGEKEKIFTTISKSAINIYSKRKAGLLFIYLFKGKFLDMKKDNRISTN